MLRFARLVVAISLPAMAAVGLLAGAPALPAQGATYTIKPIKSDVPSELNASIAKLLSPEGVQLLDGTGKPICDVWLCKQLNVDATPEQVKNGITYQELRETTVMGAIRYHQPWSDYRQQRVKAGVYTLRFGLQPMDGDHLGTADYREFFLLTAADKDAKPAPMDPKDLIEQSRKSIASGHPAILMVFPHNKPATDPKLVAEQNEHWVLQYRADVLAAGMKTSLGFGLTLVGHAKE